MKKKLILAVFLLLAAVILIIFIQRPDPLPPTIDDLKPVTYQDKFIGQIGDSYFNFETAQTNIARTTGLSGRDTLPDTDAMLFVFVAEGQHCFWMKDMKFAIDILWFDASKKLVYEKRNVSPETYPENFCPDKPAKFVVEVTAGVSDKNHLKLGEQLIID